MNHYGPHGHIILAEIVLIPKSQSSRQLIIVAAFFLLTYTSCRVVPKTIDWLGTHPAWSSPQRYGQPKPWCRRYSKWRAAPIDWKGPWQSNHEPGQARVGWWDRQVEDDSWSVCWLVTESSLQIASCCALSEMLPYLLAHWEVRYYTTNFKLAYASQSRNWWRFVVRGPVSRVNEGGLGNDWRLLRRWMHLHSSHDSPKEGGILKKESYIFNLVVRRLLHLSRFAPTNHQPPTINHGSRVRHGRLCPRSSSSTFWLDLTLLQWCSAHPFSRKQQERWLASRVTTEATRNSNNVDV